MSWLKPRPTKTHDFSGRPFLPARHYPALEPRTRHHARADPLFLPFNGTATALKHFELPPIVPTDRPPKSVPLVSIGTAWVLLACGTTLKPVSELPAIWNPVFIAREKFKPV